MPGVPSQEVKNCSSATDHLSARAALFCLVWLPLTPCHLCDFPLFRSSRGLDRGCRKYSEIKRKGCVCSQGASPGFVSWNDPVPEASTRDFMFPEDNEIQQTEQLWGFCRV